MLALAAVRAVHFAVAIQAIGALLFVFVLDRLPASAGQPAEHHARRWLISAAALLAIAGVLSGSAWLVLQAAEMTGHTVIIQAWDEGAVSLLLFKTHAGVVWWVRFAIAAALVTYLCALVSLRRASSQAAVAVGLVLAIANFISCAWLSHAGSDASPYAWLHLAAHALHMLAVSLWLGGLMPLAILLSSAWRSSDRGAAPTAYAASVSFGNIALLAVGTIVVSGIVTTVLMVRDVSDLITGTYGRLLAVKLVLFGLMLALAALNRLKLVPRLAASNDGPAATRVRWSILLELVLGLLILLAVGALGITAPGADD